MQWENRQYGKIQTNIPGDWQDNSIVQLAAEARGGYRPNIVFALREFKETPTGPGYAKYQRETLESSELQGLKVLHEGPVTLEGKELYQLSTSCQYPVPAGEQQQLVELRQDQFYVIRGNTVLTLTMTCRAVDYEELSPVFQRIAQDTEFKP